MNIQKLTLENFGPFYGKHDIDLAVSPDAPIVIIHGENMRGKTTIQNAIRWCLYGQAYGRKGLPKPSHGLLSYDAVDSGENFMSVTLAFSHEGQDFEMTRHAESQGTPVDDRSMTFSTSLRRDGHFVPQRQIAQVIEGILHHEIARFFLFDGEMLSQYEDLMDDTAYSTQLIRQSIEKILGLPALQQSEADLRILHAEAGQQQAVIVRRQKSAARTIAQEHQLSNSVNSLSSDLVSLQEIESQLSEKRDELISDRDRLVGIEADLQLEEQIEERKKSALSELQTQRQRIKTLLHDAWWQPAAGEARKISNELTIAVDEQRRISTEIALAKQNIDQLESLSGQAQCPLCNQKVDSSQHDHQAKEIENLNERIKKLNESETVSGDPSRIAVLRKFENSQSLAIIREIEESIRKSDIQTRKDNLALSEVKERLWGTDRADTKEIQRQYDDTVTQLDEVARQIVSRKQQLDETTSNLQTARRNLASSPGADPKIALKSRVLDVLVEAFSLTIDEFRISMKETVEKTASEIFRSLTTESDYKGLVINSRYGLDIVSTNDRVIKDRSAGAEQIVAFSLIGALNFAAVRKGPIVMDTPFGRLDRSHRENVLNFIPSMSEQVILLVQSGEIDEDRDLGPIEGKISHHYRLVRDGSPTKSRVVTLES